MRILLSIYLITISCSSVSAQQSFFSRQQQYGRVKIAFAEKGDIITGNLLRHNLSSDSVQVLFVAYKAEKQMDVYAKNKKDTLYRQIANYAICASSGQLGPKRQEGDGQVPEGFYHIDRFNPLSNFHLSLGINYPNQSDIRKSKATRLGGDIFIHGSCVTIGCLPMTNDKIKEIYLYALYARNNGQKNIPVYLFPFRMTDAKFELFKKQYTENQVLIDFWQNLKTGYDIFMTNTKELKAGVDAKGDYNFK
jgi:murein L,D-transpeptidase YafK